MAKFSKAWIVRWEFHGQQKKKRLAEYDIKNEVVEIFSTRKKFDEVKERVENLYRLHRLSFGEKAHLENYKSGAKNRRNMFGVSIPVFTSFQKHLTYVSVGHNPSLEGRRVHDLKIFSDGGTEILEWDEPLVDGGTKHETFTT